MTVSDARITIYRGERKAWTGTVKDEAGSVVDITDADVYFTVRTKVPAGSIVADTDGDVIFKKTVGDGITLSDPTNGEFEILVAKADTNAINIGATGKGYLYEICVVEDGQTEPKVLAVGVFTLLADIVRGV